MLHFCVVMCFKAISRPTDSMHENQKGTATSSLEIEVKEVIWPFFFSWSSNSLLIESLFEPKAGTGRRGGAQIIILVCSLQGTRVARMDKRDPRMGRTRMMKQMKTRMMRTRKTMRPLRQGTAWQLPTSTFTSAMVAL